eukprot:7447404-Pyramimonas_sp.AAC.1
MDAATTSGRRSKGSLTQDGVATLRGGLRGPPARCAALETRALTRDPTLSACAPMSAQATPLFWTPEIGTERM